MMKAPRRVGSSLVETAVVIALMSIAMGTVAVSFGSLSRLDQRFSRAADGVGDAGRLTRDLRRDIHSASGVQLRNDGWVFGTSAGEIAYSRTGDRVARKAGDATKGYRVRDLGGWSSDLADAGVGDLVEITIDLAGEPIVVVAEVGRDARVAGLARGRGSSEDDP